MTKPIENPLALQGIWHCAARFLLGCFLIYLYATTLFSNCIFLGYSTGHVCLSVGWCTTSVQTKISQYYCMESVKYGAGIHAPLRMNCKNFGDPMTFHQHCANTLSKCILTELLAWLHPLSLVPLFRIQEGPRITQRFLHSWPWPHQGHSTPSVSSIIKQRVNRTPTPEKELT